MFEASRVRETIIELRIEFTGTDRSNKKMLALCSSYVKSMQDELEEYGFHKEDLKLDSFRIRNTKGSRLIDSKKFEFVQNGKMRFPADMEKLGSASQKRQALNSRTFRAFRIPLDV